MITLILIFFPLLSALALFPVKGKNIKILALAFSIIEFILCLVAAFQFENNAMPQFMVDVPWIVSLGINFKAGIDGISMLLLLLTTFLVPLIILSSFQNEYKNPKLFYALILFMQSGLMGVFTALDGFLFYIFWEMALIPIYFICLLWGGQERIRITFKFFIYTLLGSLLMLVALTYLYLQTPGKHTFDLLAFYSLHLDRTTQGWIFWALFIAFAVKMPVFPFHTWQPDTYTDAPPQGTMLLSGIMLKMGIYGLVRLLMPIAPLGLQDWGYIAIILSIIGIVYASCIAFVQKDVKRLIAYSSIAHVGLISAGVLTFTLQGLQGGMLQMFSHGVNVVGLFFIIDIIQKRTNTRTITDLGGIRLSAPLLASFFMVIMLGSIGLPLTNGFIGEFLLFTGIFQYNPIFAAISGLTIILGAVYMLKAYQNTMLGEKNRITAIFPDLVLSEKLVLIPIVIMIFWFGIYPKPFLQMTEPTIKNLITIIGK